MSAQIYYHYYLPRAEVENILLKPGDFLVRETIMPDKRAAIILSVRGSKSPTDVDHFPIEVNLDDGTVMKLTFYSITMFLNDTILVLYRRQCCQIKHTRTY